MQNTALEVYFKCLVFRTFDRIEYSCIVVSMVFYSVES